MGLKQAATDPSSGTKKRRRVGFASIDTGVEANECIKIFLVHNKEEVGAGDSFRISPIDLNQFFDEDGRIYGYKELKVTTLFDNQAVIMDLDDVKSLRSVLSAYLVVFTRIYTISIWLSSISFYAYADIAFQSTSDGGKGITDLRNALQKIFGESLFEKKDDFLQTFSTGLNIKNVISIGEVVHCEATKGQNNKSNNQMESEAFTVEVIRLVVNSTPVGELYSRLVPLVLLLVDGGSPIDITDPRWEMYLVVQRKTDQQGDIDFKLLGFAAIYRFYHYPDSSRVRLSQILVFPHYQGHGHGRLLLEVINSVAISENVYDVTVEEPSDYLQRIRTCIDILRLLAFEPIKTAISSVSSQMKQGNLSKKTCKIQSDPPEHVVEDVRKNLKINKKQFLQCWEILIYLDLDPNDLQCMENYKTLISDRMKADIIGKDTGTSGKQTIEVPNDYDHEMTFVMFRPRDGKKVDSIDTEIEKNQSNQEEQLNQLVEVRVKEIMEVAQKVSLHRS